MKLNLKAINFAWKGVLAILIQRAEAELGGGKGEEKKKWVLAKLDELMKTAAWPSFVQAFIKALAPMLLEWVFAEIKEQLADLGKP